MSVDEHIHIFFGEIFSGAFLRRLRLLFVLESTLYGSAYLGFVLDILVTHRHGRPSIHVPS